MLALQHPNDLRLARREHQDTSAIRRSGHNNTPGLLLLMLRLACHTLSLLLGR